MDEDQHQTNLDKKCRVLCVSECCSAAQIERELTRAVEAFQRQTVRAKKSAVRMKGIAKERTDKRRVTDLPTMPTHTPHAKFDSPTVRPAPNRKKPATEQKNGC